MQKTILCILAFFFLQTIYGQPRDHRRPSTARPPAKPVSVQPVSVVPVNAQDVILYADANYLGAFKTLKPGQYVLSDFNDVTSSIKVPDGIKIVHVETTKEMEKACVKAFPGSDITVMAAAVADYAPEKYSSKKIKKNIGDKNLKLVKTQDILSALGKRKTKKQFLVGFALETENETANAKKKLREKNLDMIVLNSLNDKGAGFEHDTNKISIIDGKKVKTFDLKPKTEAAEDIVREIIIRFINK